MHRWLLFIYGSLLGPSLFGQLYFEDIADQVGIDHLYASSFAGGGVSFYDFDGDGWDDITFASSNGESIHFYRNNGGTFQRLYNLIPNQEEVKQVLWVDFDNDGDQDFFIATRHGLNRLFEQTAPLEFEDITISAGLPSFQTFTYGACFGDYDRDGYLDLYFGLRLNGTGFPNQHMLFKNNGDQTFTNVTESTMTADTSGLQFCSSFLDYNNDNWPDIYTAHDRSFTTNTLLENNGDATFSSTGEAAGADIAIDAMSVTVGDYNNDGWQDIYCTNLAIGSKFLVNEGPDETGQVIFSEQADAVGIGFYGMGWGAVFLDADNDCDQDLYVSGSDVGSNAISAAYYQNENDGTFSQPILGFVGDTMSSYNNAIGDFNNDGFPDIVVLNTFPFQSSLWSSDPVENNWFKIKLTGTESNRNGIGARITCFTGTVAQERYLQCGNGFMGQNSGTEIFGLGTHEKADSLHILWPSGWVDRLYEIPHASSIQFQEGMSDPPEMVEPSTGEAIDTLAILTSTGNIMLEQNLELYPNPSSDHLHFSIDDWVSASYSIYSGLGYSIKSGKLANSSPSISIKDLPAGLYFLSLVTDKEQFFWQSFMKQ